MMREDNLKIDAVIRLLDVGGLTLEDLRSAPLQQVINFRTLAHHWHQLADVEVRKRVEQTR
jgi:hypothetical protein